MVWGQVAQTLLEGTSGSFWLLLHSEGGACAVAVSPKVGQKPSIKVRIMSSLPSPARTQQQQELSGFSEIRGFPQ